MEVHLIPFILKNETENITFEVKGMYYTKLSRLQVVWDFWCHVIMKLSSKGLMIYSSYLFHWLSCCFSDHYLFSVTDAILFRKDSENNITAPHQKEPAEVVWACPTRKRPQWRWGPGHVGEIYDLAGLWTPQCLPECEWMDALWNGWTADDAKRSG